MVAMDTNAKTTLYADAIIVALAETGAAIGGPDINAAIAALTFAQGYIISGIKDRNARRLAEKAAGEGLGQHIAAQVNDRILREQEAGKAPGA